MISVLFLFLFIVLSITVVVLLLKFEKKQAVKVRTVLKEVRSVPPMLLLKSTEQKIAFLKGMLRYDDIPKNLADAASMPNIYDNQKENIRLSKVQELKVLSAKYNNGQISLDTYSSQLNNLIDEVQRESGSFMMAG